MIKYNGQDIADIKYNGASIKRVMKDGIQIWPAISEIPNIPTGIQLSEYDIEEPAINWDYFITYTVTTNTEVRAYLKDDVILPFTGGDDTQFGLKVNGSPVVFTNFGIHYAPGPSYVTLRNPTDFLPTDVIEFSYTAGADPIEGENTGTFAPDLVDQLVENTIVGFTYLLDDYPGAAAAYSLRKLRTGVVQGIMVRRDSDDQLVDVRLYDDPSKSIDLDSITESGGQTLGDWVGSASAYIFNWYDQSGNGNHASQSAEANQPRIVNAGVLETLNGKTALDFNGISQFLRTSDQTVSDRPNTKIDVSSLRVNTVTQYVHDGITLRSAVGQPSNRNVRIYAGLVSDYDDQHISGQQYLHFALFNGAISKLYLDSLDLGTKNIGTGGYDGVTIGAAASTASNLDGMIQEVIVYTDDQSANRIAIENEINSVYNIYVVTAEVDAQLIQADNDNVSDTVIEINGVRSSASDAAVANLIARNNTVITA